MQFLHFFGHIPSGIEYLIIFAGIGIEGICIPFPSEELLIGAAVYAALASHLSLPLIILFATTGAFIGDTAGFFIGKKKGLTFLTSHESLFHLSEHRLAKIQRYYDHYGRIVVFIGRFTAFFRIFSPLFAGINQMSYKTFLLFNLPACFLWSSMYSILAYVLAKNLPLLFSIVKPLGFGILFIVLCIIAITVGIFIYAEKKAK